MTRAVARDDVRVPSVVTTGLIVVSTIFPFLSAVALILRSHALRAHPHPFGAEDFWFWISWVSSLALSIIAWVFARSGINYYKVDPAVGTRDSLRLIFLGSCLVQLPLSSVKIAILLFYKRIFPTRTFGIYIWVAITVVALWGISIFFAVLFQIDPVSLEQIDKVRLRYNSTALGYAQVSTSIALDVLVLCFPLPVIYRLHMNLKRKLLILCVFWLGIFCVVAAIVRLVLLTKSLDEIDNNFSHIYLQNTIYIFKVIEPNASIVAACLPCYGPLIKSWRTPESIVRSVRSLVSISSGGSRGSRKRSPLHVQQGENSVGESQIELNTFANLSEQERANKVPTPGTNTVEI
ncbi:hypothetical protein K445DRAFT_315183 [Daldinia sp. EC12]|nr:hypothetical protein F4774DRAFT_399345 [Daldinia eschscholtzii]OTB18369.1 hypothetical protein K445DRAFT_315183 [Daldinia sp. EC12]